MFFKKKNGESIVYQSTAGLVFWKKFKFFFFKFNFLIYFYIVYIIMKKFKK